MGDSEASQPKNCCHCSHELDDPSSLPARLPASFSSLVPISVSWDPLAGKLFALKSMFQDLHWGVGDPNQDSIWLGHFIFLTYHAG